MGHDRELRLHRTESRKPSDVALSEHGSSWTVGVAHRDPEFTTLFVDSDQSFRVAVGCALEHLGCRVTFADTAESCLSRLVASSFDCLVVDLTCLGMDAKTVIRTARHLHPDLSAVLITDCPSSESALFAVEIKAADYLCKPLSTREATEAIISACHARLAEARQRALLAALSGAETEYRPPSPEQVTPCNPTYLKVGALILDRDGRHIWSAEFPNAGHLELTEQETVLMACLMARPGAALSPKYLAQKIVGQDLDPWSATSIIRPMIFRLRRKFLMYPHLPCTIRTAHGVGYRLCV